MKRRSLLRPPRRCEVLAERLRDDPEGRFKVVRNLETGLIQLHPLPTREEDARFYAQDRQVKAVFGHADLARLDSHFRPDKERQLELIKLHRPPPARLLDVGCGYGLSLTLAQQAGYQATGTDLPGERLEAARARGVRVLAGDLVKGNPLPPGETFDVVLLSHVLEHVLEPERFLGRLRAWLDRDGLLVIELPNAADQMLANCEAYRRFFWQRAHLAYYTPQTLGLVIQGAGYERFQILGRQRYSIASVWRWLETGRPGLGDPLYVAPEAFRWLDGIFRRDAEARLCSDALVALVQA
jgi:SAM-dependent methyltransferase